MLTRFQLSNSVDSDNILDKSKTLDGLTLHKQVLNLSMSKSSDEDGRSVVSYQDMCLNMCENVPCNYNSVFV